MTPQDVIAEVAPASAYYIERVKRKQATGFYPLESVACFCGHTDGPTVAHTDRYGFPHSMVVCAHCGLIYANRRMTADAYRQFYEQEYRAIYGDGDDTAVESARLVSKGETLRRFIEERCGLTPAVVMEVGCHDGSMLLPFADAGATVYGCDYDGGAFAPQLQGALAQGGIEQLERHGTKANLIILSHVFEHCLDLRATLDRLSALLAPNGLLYIEVPGLYAWERSQLWQNAHVWQFTAESLAYVMGCCGFEEVYANQLVESLWQYTGESQDVDEPNLAGARTAMAYLLEGKRLVPEIRTVNKFPVADRTRHMAYALATTYPDIAELVGALAGRQAVILGGGPSVDVSVERMEQLRAEGAVTFCIERMLPWCLQHGFVPDYVVAMDPSDDVIEAFHTLPSTTQYLVATQCAPSVFEKLRGLDVSIYTTPQRGIELESLWAQAGRHTITKINGGGSVTLCAMALAMTLGCQALHVMGFDCHVNGGGYAKGIAGVGEQTQFLEISAVGTVRRFRTTPAYLSFAQQFFKLMHLAVRGQMLQQVTVYGDTLVKAMHRPEGPLKDVVRV